MFIEFKINNIEHINNVKFHLSFFIELFLQIKLISKEIKKNNPEMNMDVDKKIVPI